jgi:hypothetical protein
VVYIQDEVSKRWAYMFEAFDYLDKLELLERIKVKEYVLQIFVE